MSTSETETGEGEKPAAFLGDPVAWRMRQRQGTSRYYDKDHVFDWTFAPRRYVMDDDAVCEHEPLYSKATVDHLRSEVSRLTAQVEAYREALDAIREMTDPDSGENYRADDREGCLDATHATACRALNGGGHG